MKKKSKLVVKGRYVAEHGKAKVLQVWDSLLLHYGFASGSYKKKDIDGICVTYQKRAVAVGADKTGRPFAMFEFSIAEMEAALKDVKNRIRKNKFDGAWVHLNPELSIYVRRSGRDK